MSAAIQMEMWMKFVGKILTTGVGTATAAERLHEAHIMIFGQEPLQTCSNDQDMKKVIVLLEQLVEAVNRDIEKEVKASIELEHERDKNNQVTNIFNKWLYNSEKDGRNDLDLWIEAYERFFELIEKKEAKRKQISNPH